MHAHATLEIAMLVHPLVTILEFRLFRVIQGSIGFAFILNGTLGYLRVLKGT